MFRTAYGIGATLAALTSALAIASPASASWTTNGSPTGTPTTFSGGGTLLTIVTTGASIQGISSTGTHTFTGTTLNDATVYDTDTTIITAPKIVGQNAAAACDAGAMVNATAYSPATNVTTGVWSGISCRFTKAACGNSTTVTGGITVTGSVLATYGNTSQQLTYLTSGQSLTATWSGAGCLSGTSPATVKWTNATGTALVSGVTSSFKPQVSN
jgi:hypothetical protein